MLTGNSGPWAGEFVEIVKEIVRSNATTIASGRLLMADPSTTRSTDHSA